MLSQPLNHGLLVSICETALDLGPFGWWYNFKTGITGSVRRTKNCCFCSLLDIIRLFLFLWCSGNCCVRDDRDGESVIAFLPFLAWLIALAWVLPFSSLAWLVNLCWLWLSCVDFGWLVLTLCRLALAEVLCRKYVRSVTSDRFGSRIYSTRRTQRITDVSRPDYIRDKELWNVVLTARTPLVRRTDALYVARTVPLTWL